MNRFDHWCPNLGVRSALDSPHLQQCCCCARIRCLTFVHSSARVSARQHRLIAVEACADDDRRRQPQRFLGLSRPGGFHYHLGLLACLGPQLAVLAPVLIRCICEPPPTGLVSPALSSTVQRHTCSPLLHVTMRVQQSMQLGPPLAQIVAHCSPGTDSTLLLQQHVLQLRTHRPPQVLRAAASTMSRGPAPCSAPTGAPRA